MTDKPIVFFNHYHNGDIFHSKEFVRDIATKIPVDAYYGHSRFPDLLKDLPTHHVPLPKIPQNLTVFENDDAVFVNTWIGAYFDKGLEYNGECSLRFNYSLYKTVYEKLNEIYKTDIKLDPIEHYYPSIDFDAFDCQYLSHAIDSKKTVIISNGPALSGQSIYNDAMEEVINRLASHHSNMRFIATHNFPTNASNVDFTSDIIKRKTCDLNEIAYISQRAELIIGRVSGPFCFMTHKNNIMNKKMKFLAFGNRETDFFHIGCPIKADFKYHNFTDINSLYNAIEERIECL